jgi:hypothetical protein
MSKSVKLSEYFEKTQGIGVLATTDASGQVNQAIYGRPHFLDEDDDGTCSFIMSNRLSHNNVMHNLSASHLFIEKGEGYVGKRLSLRVIGEETDPEKIKAIRHPTSRRSARRKASILSTSILRRAFADRQRIGHSN